MHRGIVDAIGYEAHRRVTDRFNDTCTNEDSGVLIYLDQTSQLCPKYGHRAKE